MESCSRTGRRNPSPHIHVRLLNYLQHNQNSMYLIHLIRIDFFFSPADTGMVCGTGGGSEVEFKAVTSSGAGVGADPRHDRHPHTLVLLPHWPRPRPQPGGDHPATGLFRDTIIASHTAYCRTVPSQ